ncbi:MAG: hypothetical protein ACC628_13230, partial [Pirellulaceae bacterium]
DQLETVMRQLQGAKPWAGTAVDQQILALEHLVIMDGSQLENIERSRRLGRLVLLGDRLTNRDLRHLEGLSVQDLSIEGTQVSNAGLARLEVLPGLRSLRLWACQFGDACLEHVKKLAQLESLDIDGTKIQGTGLEHLKDLPKLHTIVLGPSIRDADLEYLKDLTRLEEVDLRGCRHITDAGLAHIGALTELRRIWLPRQITDEGGKGIKLQLPNCEFRR